MKEIQLTQGKVALVDDDVFEALNQFKWYADRHKKTFYAKRNITLPGGRRTKCLMHREVFRLRDETVPVEVDHKDRDGLNNRRLNLRPATHTEQQRNKSVRSDNTSGHTGVSWNVDQGQWMAYVATDGKQKNLGYFDDPNEAAEVRDEYAKKHHGEFAAT